MNKILSKEVSINLAKLLFEKQIVIDTEKIWLINAEYGLNNIIGDVCIHWMEEQGYRSSNAKYNAPTIAEVIDWIYEKYQIWIEVRKNSYFKEIMFQSYINEKSLIGDLGGYISHISPLEAYEEAIKYILNTKP